MSRKIQQGPQVVLRLSKDEGTVLEMYGKMLNKTKPGRQASKSGIIHGFIAEHMTYMLLAVNRYEAEEEAKAPGAADWPPTLPDRENKATVQK